MKALPQNSQITQKNNTRTFVKLCVNLCVLCGFCFIPALVGVSPTGTGLDFIATDYTDCFHLYNL